MTPPVEKYLTATATVEDPSGVDGYGKKSYAAPRDARCRIERLNTVVKDAQGRDVAAAATGFFMPDDTIALGSRVTFRGAVYTVVNVDQPPFTDADSHIEAVLSLETR